MVCFGPSTSARSAPFSPFLLACSFCSPSSFHFPNLSTSGQDENDECRHAQFLYLSIRFSMFALRRLLAVVFSSHAPLDEWEAPKRIDRATEGSQREPLGVIPPELSIVLSID